MTKGSDLLVAALENEGVDRIFGVPGEENLDVVESLRTSRIELILTRHEQAAGFMAATHGRLTGRPGVCISTLGPGALNFSTAAAYAHLGAMPMIMITGQKAIMSARQARFQIVDVVASMKPLTKMTRQIVSPHSIPTVVRDAFRVATEERPGPVHLELPEDVAGEQVTARCVRFRCIRSIVRSPIPTRSIARRAMILAAKRPLIMIGAAGNRPRLVGPLSDFVRRMRHPVLQHADGQGRRRRRLEPLCRHGSAFRARLCARCDRALGPDHRDRARHGRKAAIPDARRGRPEGHPYRLHVGRRSSRSSIPMPRWSATSARRWPASPTGLAASSIPTVRSCALRQTILAAINDRSEEDRFPITPQRIVHDVRAVDARGRHRLPGQRHVQDLVRPQLPHPPCQHAAARQRAGDHGGGLAVGDHGGAAPSRAPRHGGVRRWRLHDELAGAGDRRSPEAQPGRDDPQRRRLRHDPLEAGGRRLPGLRPDIRQSRLRALRRVLRRQGFARRARSRISCRRWRRLSTEAASISSTCRSTIRRMPASWSTSCAAISQARKRNEASVTVRLPPGSRRCRRYSRRAAPIRSQVLPLDCDCLAK